MFQAECWTSEMPLLVDACTKLWVILKQRGKLLAPFNLLLNRKNACLLLGWPRAIAQGPVLWERSGTLWCNLQCQSVVTAGVRWKPLLLNWAQVSNYVLLYIGYDEFQWNMEDPETIIFIHALVLNSKLFCHRHMKVRKSCQRCW